MGVTEAIFITPAETMKILRVGKNRLYEDLLKRKDFPAMRLGGKYYINKSLLEDWAAKQCLNK